MTRVYAYWCDPVSKHDADLLNVQIRLATTYRRALVAIDNQHRAGQRERDHANPIVARLDLRLHAMFRYDASMHEQIQHEDTSETPDQIKLIKLAAKRKIVTTVIPQLKARLQVLRAARRKVEEARDLADPIIARKYVKVKALTRYAKVMSKSHPKRKIAMSAIRRLNKQLVALRAVRRQDPTWVLLERDHLDGMHEAMRGARSVAAKADLNWGTYQFVEDAHDQATSTTPIWNDVTEPHRGGDGAIAIHIQNRTLTGADLMGNDAWVRIDPEPYALSPRVHGYAERQENAVTRGGALCPKRLRELLLRVGSDANRKPIWCHLHVLMHRAISDNAKISWIRIHRTHCGLRWRYSVQFVVDDHITDNAEANLESVVGVGVGWRRVSGTHGIRTAFGLGSDGVTHELVIPDRVLQRQVKSDGLRSTRDQNRDGIRDQLVTWRRVLDAHVLQVSTHAEMWHYIGWHRATAHLYQWTKVGRFVLLHKAWANARFGGDAQMFDGVTAWLKQDRHLLGWEANNVRRMHLQIKGRQEQWVAQLCKRYGTVCVTGVIHIDRMRSRTTAKDESARQAAVAHTSTSPGELRERLVRKAKLALEIDPAFMTATCACGVIRQIDQKPLVLKCPACGREEDQDLTLARNILNAGVALLASGGPRGPNGKPLAPVTSTGKQPKRGSRRGRIR